MKTIRKFTIVLAVLFLTGCEDVISVDLDTAAPKLVIDASIDWVKGTTGNEQKIKLSTTTGYYSSTFPTVSGATITVENTASAIFDFIETAGTGEYICNNFQPVMGETYTLTILLNGEIYTATETLTGVPSIEAEVIQNNDAGFGGDEVEILTKFQDNATEQNNYLFSHKSNRVAFPEYEVEDDENDNGNLITMYYSNKDLKPGDLMNIKLYGISRRYYEYFNKLLLASGGDSGPFPSTPVAVRGNIINETNFNNFAFGYFRLSEVDVKKYTLQ